MDLERKHCENIRLYFFALKQNYASLPHRIQQYIDRIPEALADVEDIHDDADWRCYYLQRIAELLHSWCSLKMTERFAAHHKSISHIISSPHDASEIFFTFAGTSDWECVSYHMHNPLEQIGHAHSIETVRDVASWQDRNVVVACGDCIKIIRISFFNEIQIIESQDFINPPQRVAMNQYGNGICMDDFGLVHTLHVAANNLFSPNQQYHDCGRPRDIIARSNDSMISAHYPDAGPKGRLQIWNPVNTTKLFTKGSEMRFSDAPTSIKEIDHNRILVGCEQSLFIVAINATHEFEEPISLPLPESPQNANIAVRDIAIASDGTIFVAQEHQIAVYQQQKDKTYRLIHTFAPSAQEGHRAPTITSLAVSTGDTILMGCSDGSIQRWRKHSSTIS